ncbi:agarase [Bacillus sp. MUM 13]|nr:agarase [Bacillus sp. MUM 13]
MDLYGGNEKRKFEGTGYFRLEKESDRWWLVDPEGSAFVTIGVNHADETNLKYDHNFEIWKEKYGSRENWIKGLVKDLKDWGFNTIGWTGDYISGDWGQALDWFGDPINLGHSSSWAAADYKIADMPYCLQIRVAEIEDWNGQPAYPDVYSREFDMYCEYLARSICANHAESKNLIGYFLVDIPGWLPHASGKDFKGLEGLDKEERKSKLFDVASKYYETITKHIRKYDPNHLILGDRYNGNKGIPTEVLEAAKPYVDVLSVQYFPSNNEEGYQQMKEDLAKWQALIDKPVINADIGNWCQTKMNPNRVSDLQTQADRARDYIDSISSLINEPWFIGWHWCAHVENKARGWGIKDPYDQPYNDFINPVKGFNKEIYEKI